MNVLDYQIREAAGTSMSALHSLPYLFPGKILSSRTIHYGHRE
jgi:hypothetical protein